MDTHATGAPNVKQHRNFQLSINQRDIWFDCQMNPNLPNYNLGGFCRISVNVDPHLFERALLDTVARNRALRLSPVPCPDGGLPSQAHVAPEAITLQHLDLSKTPAPREAADTWMSERMAQPFKLDGRPLCAFALIKLADDCHYWFMCAHHLVLDGWSIALLNREVIADYTALLNGRTRETPSNAGHYSEFVEAEQQYLQSPRHERDARYWNERFQELPERLFQPRQRPAGPGYGVSSERTTLLIPRDHYNGITASLSERGSSMFHLILAALYVYMTRAYNRDELIVGVPILNRTGARAKRMIGLFAGVMPARFRFNDGLTVVQLQRRIAESLRRDYRHQRFPLAELNRALGLQKRARRQLFDIHLSFMSHDYHAEVEGKPVHITFLPNGHGQDPLAVYVRDFHRDGPVAIDFDFNLAYFTATEIDRLRGCFMHLLDQMHQHPDMRPHHLSLMPQDERALLLQTFGAGPHQEIPAQTIIDCIEATALKKGDAPALAHGDRQISYADLNENANRLTRFILSETTSPCPIIAVPADRSPDWVTAMLAVLKAGGVYLPLDPDLPDTRLAYMLKQSGAVAVLAQGESADRFVSFNLPLINTQTARPQIEGLPAVNLSRKPTGDSPAYIIFTSGSTGKPKGAVLHHAGLTNLAVTQAQDLDLDGGSRLFQFASGGFDASINELASTLSAGAALDLGEGGKPLPDNHFVAMLRRRVVTHIILPPSALAAMPEADLHSLSTIVVAGEACPREVITRWAPGRRFLNAYGPTEATVCASMALCQVGEPVTIGKPIPNTQLYIVDRYLQPLPLGVAGALCIAGVGLARGYQNLPTMTAQRFTPNPFSHTPGARLYHSGDLAAWDASGALVFKGRLDDQVKLRGYRIEPDEIARVLTLHQAIAEAAVIARTHTTGELVLTAYLVFADSISQSERESFNAKTFLSDRLPAYMIPGRFINLPHLPRNSSGKTDKRVLQTLPDSAAHDSPDTGVYVPPATETERMLVDIWTEVLGLESVGVTDDFFELGGHSLHATRAATRMSRALSFDLPVRFLFEKPTIRSLLAAIGQDHGDAGQSDGRQVEEALPPIQVQTRGQEPELSFAQQRMWFLDQLESGSAFYNTPATARLEGPLNVPAMEKAVNLIVARHEAPRTTYVSRRGKAVQVITPKLELKTPLIDLTRLAAPSRQSHAIARTLVSTPFDLAVGPMFRVNLIRLKPDRHLIVLVMHHISSDGWSMGVLLRELAAYYEIFSQDGTPMVDPLPLQYADYAAWQRQWLKGERLDRQVNYWKERLAGAPSAIDLPLDLPRPAVEAFRGAILNGYFSAALNARLQGLGRRCNATLFMVLLAAWDILLAHYTRQRDIVVGTPVANRRRPELEGLIGFFANTLVMRTDLSGDPSFIEVIARVRQTALGAYAHQDAPFEALVEALDVKRDMSRAPIFQVMLVLQNAPLPSLRMGPLKLAREHVDPGIAKFDLTLFTWEEEGRLAYTFEYNTDLFLHATAERMMAHFGCLMEALLNAPEKRVWDIPLMCAYERTELLTTMNQTREDFGPSRDFTERIAAQVTAAPDATAVVGVGGSLSYAAFWRRAGALAKVLRTLGAGPERVVGVMLDRDLDMAAAFAAVLQTGAPLVALDPAYPRERLAFIAGDAGLCAVITQAQLRDTLPEDGPPLVLVETIPHHPSLGPEAAPAKRDPANLLYVIYTSGSTGQPKGVGVPTHAIHNLIDWQEHRTALRGVARTLQFAAFGFCVSFQEMLSAWCAGGPVIIASEAERRDVEKLHDLVEEQQIERLHLPFAALKQLAMATRAGKRQLPASLRDVITAGEQLQITEEMRSLFTALNGCRLHNQYGASETHVISALTLEGVPDVWPLFPTVGHPISKTRIYLLDGYLNMAPKGIPAEVYAADACVARGYVQRPDLTAERFVPNPFGGEVGSRLYRTGDLARYMDDGAIRYMGRADEMVKIRGYRVEPGEVEAALREHESVADAAVPALKDKSGAYRLAAYVVPRGDELDTAALTAFLEKRLPPYMIPRAMVRMAALPVNANGKLDRDALPEPDFDHTGMNRTYTSPRTATERDLAAIWAEILEVRQVGRDDDFFVLGGHSLLATRVVSRVREVFGVEIPLRILFESQTLQLLAARIEEQRQAHHGLISLPPIEHSEQAPPCLSLAQRRLWFLEQLEGPNPTYNMHAALHLNGLLDVELLARGLSRVIARHETLRARFPVSKGEPVVVVHPTPQIGLQVVDLRDSGDGRGQALALEHADRTFDLVHGPLLSVVLLREAADRHHLLVNMHHIISDGWSIGVMIRELAAHYTADINSRQNNEADLLLPLTVTYSDFARWERSRPAGEALESRLGYWRRQMADAPPLLELPTDHRRPAVRGIGGAVLPFDLTGSDRAKLETICQERGATLFMVLETVFAALMQRYSRQEEVVVGVPLANRTRHEIEPLIGLFVNTLPLRHHFYGGQSFLDLLDQTRDTALAAFAHQDVPFERIVEAVQPERNRGYTPLFQVMFTLQEAPLERLALPGLVLRPAVTRQTTAKYDLTMNLAQTLEGLHGYLEYSTALFQRETAARLLTHFARLVRSIALAPQLPPSIHELTDEAERKQLLEIFNQTNRTFPHESSLHDLFHEQAQRTPDAVAVREDGSNQTITYAALAERAARLALWLRDYGVCLETPVGLCAGRGATGISGMLAILAAGGVYLPLDPVYPVERLDFIVGDAVAPLVLCEERYADDMPSSAYVLVIEALEAEETPEHGLPQVAAESLAYIMYTSGSTGLPKGVAVPHRAVARLVLNTDFAVVAPGDVVAHLANTAFDASTFEVWGPLLNGGAAICLHRETVLEPARLAAAFRNHRIDHTFLTTALFNRLADSAETPFTGMKTVMVGGEACHPDQVRRVLENQAPRKLINIYGPTENTTFSTWHQVEAVAQDALSVPIGKPIANSMAYVLDATMRPLPTGIPGELYLGGAGLSRGYLYKPAETAARFLPNPFADTAGDRVYRTGDLVRFDGQGNILFVGRTDDQVKIRGFRIELGEIEVAIKKHSGVKDAVVLVQRAEAGGNARLVAFVIEAPDNHLCTPIEAGDLGPLHHNLESSLPDYMLPNAYVPVADFPLNANGKLDKRRLAVMEQAHAARDLDVRDTPATPTEARLAEIWAEALGLERVGTRKDFFHLGGHSLMATTVMARISDAFNVSLPLHTLFDNPTVVQLAARITEAAERDLPPIRPTKAEPILSMPQQRLWFLDRFDNSGSAYNVPAALRLRGRFSPLALERAVAAVTRRHHLLRAVFPENDGQPRLTIRDALTIPVKLIDLSSLPANVLLVDALVRADARRPFDLTRDVLLRIGLVRLASDEHLLLLNMHHIISDGWSMSILVRELSAHYLAEVTGVPADLPEPILQYTDFAHWQRNWLSDKTLNTQLDYWVKQLADAPPTLDLPTDRPRPENFSFVCARHSLLIPRALADAFFAVGIAAGATPFMSLMAAFSLLMRRYSGQNDIVLGVPVAGRHRPGTENLIGFFINTLVMRNRLDDGGSFNKQLEHTRRMALDAFEHQDTPFEKLVEVLRPRRDTSRNPLFQVFFNMLNLPSRDANLPGLGISHYAEPDIDSKFDLTVYLEDVGAGLEIRLNYNAALFDAARMHLLAQHFQTLLSQITAAPDAAIERYTLAARDSRLPDPSITLASPWVGPVTDLLQRTALQQPQHPALISQACVVSRSALLARVSHLAGRLRDHGLGQGKLVAVYAARSTAMISALYGVLGSGAAYTILDPAYPPARLTAILKEAQPHAWLALEAAGDIPEAVQKARDGMDPALRITWADDVSEDSNDFEAAAMKLVSPAPDAIAHIAFTSGSTGKPKGIVARHRPLSQFVPFLQERLALSENDRFSMLSGLAHDPLQRDIFLCQSVGATLCVPEQSDIGPERLAAWMAARGITIANLTPAMGAILVDAAPSMQLTGLRHVLYVGEALDVSQVKQLWRLAPETEVHNLYGATETQQALAYYSISKDAPITRQERGMLPLGQGFPGVQLLILRGGDQQAAIGELGEICFRSPYLAQGYLHDAEQTAERFVANPFTENEDDRLYRTGDLGRYLPDGSVAFHTRVDGQVQIRGFRVELGEIQTRLEALPKIARAAVIAKTAAWGETRLIAFIVTHDELEAGAGKYRLQLRDLLPDYMVPSAIIPLEALPLTPNGKLDERALLAMPVPSELTEPAHHREPSGPTETALAAIWAEVLERDRISADADFFELGGHSLMAARIVSRVRDQLNVVLPLRAMFKHSRLNTLAREIEAPAGGDPAVAGPIKTNAPIEPSINQVRLWFLYALEGPSATYNIVAAPHFLGRPDILGLEWALARISDRHHIVRANFNEDDGQVRLTIRRPAPPSLPVVDLSGLPNPIGAAKLLAEQHALQPFLLERDALLRQLLLRIAPDHHVLPVSMHHIISDGWSMQILIRELSAFYREVVTAEPARVAELPIAYTDFAHWQRRMSDHGEQTHQLAYWKQQLSGEPATLEFPTDRPRPKQLTFTGGKLLVKYPPALSHTLRKTAKAESATLFMTLLSAFKLLLHRYSGQDDIIVGTPTAGRNQSGVENLIGFFINMLVLRTHVSAEGEPMTFRQLLRSVRETTLAAFENQDIPFEKLVEVLQPARDQSRNPLFQIFFNMLNLPTHQVDLPGLRLAGLEQPDMGSKFDLTVYLDDREEGLALKLHYNTQLFDGARMAALADQYRVLLEQVAADPDAAIHTYRLTAENPALPDPSLDLDDVWRGAVHELFSRRAQLHPDRPAVRSASVTLSYDALEKSANYLAHQLRANGIGKGQVVAIYAHRDPSLVSAVLGILKSGAAYTILDPSYPETRLVELVQASHLNGWLALSTAGTPPESVSQTLEEQPLACSIIWNGTLDKSQAFPKSAPHVTIEPDDPALIAFTSGSTGKPKGIVGRHGPLTHFLPWMAEIWAMGEKDRFAMLSGLAHDPLQRDIFTPLNLGAELHIPDEDAIGPGRLAAWLASTHVTVMHLTPAMGNLLTDTEWEQSLPDPRLAFFVGEALPGAQVSRLLKLAPNLKVVNLYGSTETQRAVSYFPVTPQWLEARGGHAIIPLGHGMPGAQLLILNQTGSLAGVGELGEIHFRSKHLAQGYLDDPELTAARFIVNPMNSDPTDRLYRTGDLGRYLPDGNAVFCGRADLQVKIRGFRVELGEIQARLEAHDLVGRAAVILRGDGVDKRLLAYVVLRGEPVENPANQLREELKRWLPDYMVPSAVIPLDALPLTPNRKLDVKALPEPELETRVAHREPREGTEAKLAEMWREVLPCGRIGADDNFFDLGGHSLMAARVIARIRAGFAVDLPLRSIFNAPTVAELAQLIETQSEQVDAAPPIIHVERDAYPLSFSQSRLWFLHLLEGESPAYNMCFAVQLNGRGHTAALEYAFNRIVARHAVLRSRFTQVEDQAVQIIAPYRRFELTVVELPDGDWVQRHVDKVAGQVFNLEQPPLIRALLLRLRDNRHILITNMHHIVSDGWSMGVFTRELVEYSQQATNDPQSITEPTGAGASIQYADYAYWQRQWLTDARLEKHLNYFRGHLAGAPALLELPTDFPRPAVQNYRGDVCVHHIDSRLTDRLTGLGGAHGASLYMTLLAAFKLLLMRYSGQNDVCVGSPVANRGQAEVEGLIGFFVNTLVLRTQITERNPSFAQMLAQVRDNCLEGFNHQELPFEYLVEALNPERDMSYSPLFQVMFTLQNTPVSAVDLPGLHLEPLPVKRHAAKFDLELNVTPLDGGLKCSWEYDADLFTAGAVDRLATRFEVLLEAVAEDAAQSVFAYSLHCGREREQLAVWNATDAPLPAVPIFHTLFEAQAARTPDATAAVFNRGGMIETISYAKLNRDANRLAHHLRAYGVGPEKIVALLEQRDIQFLTAILAVFKAGGAYLPLNPDHPAARQAKVLIQAQPRVVLYERSYQEVVDDACEWAELDSPCMLLADILKKSGPDHNPQGPACLPDNLAYTIFTSGSTGQPKGAMVLQRGMVNHLLAKTDDLHIDARDHIAQNANQCFDISVWQFLAGLMHGGTTFIYDDATAAEPERLMRAVTAQRITLLEVVPSVMRVMVEALHREDHPLDALRWLIPTGEALPPELARRWLELLPHVPLLNAYGPTECSDDVTHYAISRPPADEMANTPIGTPIRNIRLYVVDSRLRSVPLGVRGECLVTGIGVGRGYLDDPVRTSMAFIPSPFGEPGSRAYRTGDLVRRLALADGGPGPLEFLGRIDHQVKLRGFRIELGEIEAALVRHHLFAEAVVLLHTRSGNPRLVAYLTLEAGVAKPDQLAGELTSYLSGFLPDYMVPSAFLVLDRMPLTPNGKIDRKALDAISPESADSVPSDPPKTPAEILLASLWHQLLEVPKIGRDSDFFTLGGHSLLATRLIARVRESFGVDLHVRAVFEHPTPRRLAEAIAAGRRRTLPPITPLAEGQDIPLSFAQQRLWLLHHIDGPSATYNMPAALNLKGLLDADALRTALCQVVARHDSLRMTFHSEGERGLVRLIPAYDPFAVIDLSHYARRSRERMIAHISRIHAAAYFNLTNGPLSRVRLLLISPEERILLINMHHIVSDGWSVGILVGELSDAYTDLVSQKSPQPKQLAVSYADYAAWQRQWFKDGVLAERLAFWRGHLEGIPALLELPTDHPRPAIKRYRGAFHRADLPVYLVAKLEELGRAQGATLFMTLLAAFQTLLGRYSGQTDITTGTPIANRADSGTEDLIGFFVNTLVPRARLGGNPTFLKLLHQVRKTCLDIYDHQDLPFEQLVEALNPNRDTSYTPLFQAMFALQNAPMKPRKLPGLYMNPAAAGSQVAKFDLELNAMPENGGLVCGWNYDSDLFEVATIAKMAGHFALLLEGIITDGGIRPIHAYPLLTEAERFSLIRWNETDSVDQKGVLFPQLFAAQAARSPEAVAAVHEGRLVSYQCLNQRAERMADVLRGLGVGQESIVAIAADRGIEFLTVILAVFKAGGAYLPLDASHPPARHAHILRQAKPQLILHDRDRAGVIKAALHELGGDPVMTTCEISGLNEAGVSHGSSSATEIQPEQLAYVIFTSGSTGLPKGAMVAHQGMVNHLQAKLEDLGMHAGDRLAQNAGQCFDISVWQFLAPLTIGAVTVIYDDDTARDPAALIARVAQNHITLLEVVPAVMRVMVDAMEESPNHRNALRQLIPTGEALPPELARRWLALMPEVPLLNAYGPTECSDDVTHYALEQAPSMETANMPIGTPVRNTRIHVTDRTMQLVPDGVHGGCLVGGVGLGRGYLADPVRTALAFVPNPYEGSGLRLYHTGDRVRRLPEHLDATRPLEFLGRMDHQVKLRGFRIELGEIEAVLARHPIVSQTVVTHGELDGGAYLAAYATVRQSVEVDALTRYLAENLPEYMVPAAMIILDEMPLTPNGKIDRKRLPTPNLDNLPEGYLAPRDHLESELVGLWERVLERRPIGMRDDFFERGGHSLTAVRLMGLINQQLGVELPPAALFHNTTPARLADLLRSSRPDQSWPTLVPLKRIRETTQQPLFLLPGSGGHVFYLHRLAGYLDSQTPCYGLQGPGLDGHEKPSESVEAMAAHHIRDMQSVQPQGPYRLAGHSFGGRVAFEVARQLEAMGESVSLLAILDVAAPGTSDPTAFADWDELDWMDLAMRTLEANHEVKLELTREMLRQVEGQARYELLTKHLSAAEAIPPGVGTRIVKALLEVFALNILNNVRYRAECRIKSKVTLFRVTEGEPPTGAFADLADWGWAALAEAAVDIVKVPGDHNTMLHEPNVKVLAARLNELLG